MKKEMNISYQKNYKISLFYFKQTIILFSVSLFLFTLSYMYPLGILGVIVFVRALFMLVSEARAYQRYSVKITDEGYFITRDKEDIFIPISDVIDSTFKVSFLHYYTLNVKTESKDRNKYFSNYVFPYILV